jgi:hypothetical protein
LADVGAGDWASVAMSDAADGRSLKGPGRDGRLDFLQLLRITGSRDVWKFFVENFANIRSRGASGRDGFILKGAARRTSSRPANFGNYIHDAHPLWE